jgi:hypothetical protein
MAYNEDSPRESYSSRYWYVLHRCHLGWFVVDTALSSVIPAGRAWVDARRGTVGARYLGDSSVHRTRYRRSVSVRYRLVSEWISEMSQSPIQIMSNACSPRRAFQYAIAVVLAVSLLSTGVIAESPQSPVNIGNVSEERQPQSATYKPTVTTRVEVQPDRTVNYEIQMNMSQLAFNQVRSKARTQGYDSVAGVFKSQITPKSFSGKFKYSKTRNGNIVTLTIQLKNFTPTNGSLVVRKANGTMTFADQAFGTWSGGTVHYYLTMPGEITNTTANRTDGNTAEWHFSGSSSGQTRIYARSKISNEGGTSGMLLPGAMIVGGLVVLVGVVFAFSRRDRL